MKKKTYYITGLWLILLLIVLVVVGCICAPFIFVDYEKYELLCYVITVVLIIYIVLLVSNRPLVLIEFSDRLVLKYEFKSETIFYDHVEYIEYPYYDEPGNEMSRCIRIVFKDKSERLIYDAYNGFSTFAERWNKAHNRNVKANDLDIVSHYKSKSFEYSFVPEYLHCMQTYKVAAVVLFLLFVVVLVSFGIFRLAKCWPLLVIVYCGYLWSRPLFTRLYVCNDELIAKNAIVSGANVSIPLTDVKYMKLRPKYLKVTMKNADTDYEIICIMSERQRRKFVHSFNSMGIIVL